MTKFSDSIISVEKSRRIKFIFNLLYLLYFFLRVRDEVLQITMSSFLCRPAGQRQDATENLQ